jgi:hypothetical protein
MAAPITATTNKITSRISGRSTNDRAVSQLMAEEHSAN